MLSLEQLRAAQKRIGENIAPTPQIAWPLLGERLGAQVYVKHENHTPTGAFKVRGGLVLLDRLKRENPEIAGIISATRGNHGQSLAFAGRRFGVDVTIVVPHGNSVEKNAAIKAFGARLIEYGDDFQIAREQAERLALAHNLVMVPAFHRDLVLGVATYALEFLSAVPDLDRLYVPIGQGSGICGCILVRDALGLSTEIVGVQSTHAPSFALSFEQGRIVTTPTAQTFADGLATRAPDEEALAIILKGAARIILVDDAAIAAAIGHYWTDTHNLAEGAGAASLAAAIQERESCRGKKIGLILSGANIDLADFRARVGI